MPGKRHTPKQKQQAITLRAAGYTVPAISDITGVSISALNRLYSEYNVSKGKLSQEVIQKATDQLINDANAIETIKREAATLILDDLSIAKRLRAKIAETNDQLSATDTQEALQVMRALSAGAVALKSTSETLRKTLGLDKDNDVTEELPSLTVRDMTEAQMEEVRSKARAKLLGTDDGLDGTIDDNDEYDDEVVEHGYDDETAKEAGDVTR
jgi:hypothetical protein